MQAGERSKGSRHSGWMTNENFLANCSAKCMKLYKYDVYDMNM